MTSAKVTTDHAEIRKWVEARHGVPVHMQSPRTSDDVGLLRIVRR